jgi:hypothetical protein
MKLLSPEATNAKLSKNAGTNSGYETSILYLAPSTQARAGVDLCPGASDGCRKACLFTAGRGRFQNVHDARVAKTLRYLDDRASFLADLMADLEYLVRKQNRTGIKQAVRLNGTSDIKWEREGITRNGVNYAGIPQAFPELQFYDYTKLPARLGAALPRNYHLTFSRAEHNDFVARRLAQLGHNVAIVFAGELPSEYMGRPVIDGTTHDQRFLDPRGVIVGLVAKGAAKRDDSGFVIINSVA